MNVKETMEHITAACGNGRVLLTAVMFNHDQMKEPGKEDNVLYDACRKQLLAKITAYYCKLTGIPEYKFPFSEAVVLEMHVRVRKLTGELKHAVRMNLVTNKVINKLTDGGQLQLF